MNPALEIRKLCKSFGGLKVTDSVSFSLPVGARQALIGPNGAGKTTLINLLTGSLQPSSGQVLLQGEDVTAMAAHRRVRRGLSRTFQINALFPQLRVREAVMLAACQSHHADWLTRCLVPLYKRRRAAERAEEVLCQLGLVAQADRPIGELAYGRQRLVEIALALVSDPKVLLLDEPAAGIPEGESADMFDTLAQLPADISVLLIEHDMELVFRFAQRITVLVAGALLLEGTPSEVANDARVREVYLGGHAV
ncbi:MAG TPA: ABC transporter ATP-binding protein [Burkholderiaceae bacterium]|nr:ABC transporter ATP-binding protein [Burkholderiaceae bacterium]